MNCINKVGIIGEGKMGSSIFHYILPFDLDLVWVCSPDADIDKISKQFIKRITRSLDTGIIDEPRFDRLMNTVITRDLCELQTCDLIIEAVPEKLELKKNLFARLNKVVKPDAIFASNSSSINPSEMTPDGKRNGKFIGLHFFFPVSLKNIVELTVTDDTSEHTLLIVESFLLGIQRRFITLDERNSFMLNKIFL
ncbi:MAG: 3-hydroxyacyl-CoA dehydrogenase NAD-binding domain-containing protein, partial [Bacteroidales bacterium]|nr:3-hydroxyacyl-CoA dehydrogenase NAD-binding domain-containing protein [Bacteroidales bacterium]